MRITRLTVYQLVLPLNEPYFLSGGRLRFDQLDSTFIRIDTNEGISGWGEACPWGHTYLPAHGPGVRSGIETLVPNVIGQDPLALDELNRIMDTQLPGHLYAKSPIDMACWDILGNATGMPLWKLFGASEAHPVPVNSSISAGTPQEMLGLITRAALRGYKVHSAKIGGDDIARDIERIEAISKGLPKGHSVTFDINRAWTPATAVQVLNSVSSRAWIEQPCETMEECAHVAQRVQNPIMLDECLHDFQDHLSSWKMGACEGVKIKPDRVGGLTKARRIRDFGLSVGWQMHIEDVGGSALADTAAIHLASSTPDRNRLASWLCHDHLAIDPVPDQGARNDNGSARPPDTAGIGVVPDPKMLGEPVAVYEA